MRDDDVIAAMATSSTNHKRPSDDVIAVILDHVGALRQSGEKYRTSTTTTRSMDSSYDTTNMNKPITEMYHRMTITQINSIIQRRTSYIKQLSPHYRRSLQVSTCSASRLSSDSLDLVKHARHINAVQIQMSVNSSILITTNSSRSTRIE